MYHTSLLLHLDLWCLPQMFVSLACYYIKIWDVYLKCSYHTSLLLHLDLGCLPQMFAFNPLESFTNIQIEFIPDANKCDSMLRITYLSQLHFNFSVSHFCFVFVLNCVSVPFSRWTHFTETLWEIVILLFTRWKIVT